MVFDAAAIINSEEGVLKRDSEDVRKELMNAIVAHGF